MAEAADAAERRQAGWMAAAQAGAGAAYGALLRECVHVIRAIARRRGSLARAGRGRRAGRAADHPSRAPGPTIWPARSQLSWPELTNWPPGTPALSTKHSHVTADLDAAVGGSTQLATDC